MKQLCESLRPRLGLFGVFGNHDTYDLRSRLADLPVQWLSNRSHRFGDWPLRITGLEDEHLAKPDSVASLFNRSRDPVLAPDDPPANNGQTLHLLLCHSPHMLPVAADLGTDLMFSGHTHGGQLRLPLRRALVNSTDLPLGLTTGILRHRDTLNVISRGLGEVRLPLRLFCSAHLPVYTLRRGSLPGKTTDAVVNVHPW